MRLIQSAIRDRCLRVNRLAVESLIGSELQLCEFASFAHSLFLLLDHDLLAPLCELLYSQVRAGQPACEELALNLNLRACLLAGRPACHAARFANSVWLSLAPEPPSASAESGLALMEGLALNCEPPWPLGIVFTEATLRVSGRELSKL